MWSNVETQLATLLKGQIYPLLRGIPEYDALLVAGVPDAVRCETAAARIVSDIRMSRGVREFGSRQVASAAIWKEELFRGVSTRNNPYGNWWFDASLVRRWEQNYSTFLARDVRKNKILQSLRPMLAVCYDWNDFTQLWLMRVQGAGIPVISGQGSGQTIFSPNAHDGYHQNRNVYFIGGYQQIYVPFVPRGVVVQYAL